MVPSFRFQIRYIYIYIYFLFCEGRSTLKNCFLILVRSCPSAMMKICCFQHLQSKLVKIILFSTAFGRLYASSFSRCCSCCSILFFFSLPCSSHTVKVEQFRKFQTKMFINTVICFWSIWTELFSVIFIAVKRDSDRERESWSSRTSEIDKKFVFVDFHIYVDMRAYNVPTTMAIVKRTNSICIQPVPLHRIHSICSYHFTTWDCALCEFILFCCCSVFVFVFFFLV